MFNFIKRKTFWVLFVVLIIFLIIISSSSSNRKEITFAEKMIRDAYAPMQSGVSNFKEYFCDFGVYFKQKKEMEKEIEYLKEQNDKLNNENQQLLEYRAEARRLKEILDFEQSTFESYKLVPASLIGRSPNNWYETITIDKGMQDGIAKDMAVISPAGLVGRIDSVSQNTAQVFLITDREMAVGVILQENRDTKGIVEGCSVRNLLHMEHIPYYSDIKKGDKIICSGLSEIYPKGIRVGIVKEVKREANGLLLSATVTPAVDFDRLEEVLVIKDFRVVNSGE